MEYDHDYRVRMALAGRAYDTDVVRIVDRNLDGCTHLVACRTGLYAVNRDTRRLIAHGQFYGITIDRDAIYAFEACDRPRHRTARGRIVCLHRRGDRIERGDVIVRGLDNGCHQLDLIGDRLYLCDTYNQRILHVARDGGEPVELHPLPPVGEGGAGYVHCNSLLASGDHIYLLLHNDSSRTGRDSAVAVLDRAWRRVGTVPLAGQGCHGLAILDDGVLISCGSARGEVIGSDGREIAVSALMTRGLSVDEAGFVVGGSVKSERDRRDEVPGEVYFLDRDGRRLATLAMPGPVLEIRRIDGRDRSLSRHLAQGTAHDLDAPDAP